MLICKDGCGAENPDTASQCQRCGRGMHTALRLHNPGALIRHYRIKRVIGWGGFGAVYEAEDIHEQGRHVAIKESFDPAGLSSFQGEFHALQQHQHPYLPRYEAMFVEQGNAYLVMEFIPGQSLDEVLQAEGGSLPAQQVLGFMLQLCEVLEYLHSRKPPLIHRDIKPANVRLTPSGRIKLVDFGLFKQGNDATKLSRMGLTPAYAPPEQHPLAPGRTDQRSDIYSLGATCYHLLMGKAPITAFERIQTAKPAPLVLHERHNPQLAPHISRAINKAMSLKPDDRYPTVAAFKQALMSQPHHPNTQQAFMSQLIRRLRAIPGMTDAHDRDFCRARLAITFQDGTTIRLWKNPVGVDHVFVADALGMLHFGGFVGWAHAAGLRRALRAIQAEQERIGSGE
ncbi:MAG: serine/threonine protein kinase [Candidatus Viridilinea halotolerans]|uniref:non-specific serine/threonine protein kinase n=1 Tax=Candidatus Viridilinea halotolerans TaxID=2491704 RepID=A0A426U754_9CHLR|nr:MAG: serine/threonine protein kinase [Candidatus Viridilinea halotolerans]